MKINKHKVVPLDDSFELEAIESRIKSVSNFLGEASLIEVVNSPMAALFLVDDFGVIGAINVLPGQFAEAHVTFWDHKLTRSRIEVCKEVAELIMHIANLEFLITAMPSELKGLVRFAERIGFVQFQRINGITSLVMPRKGLQ